MFSPIYLRLEGSVPPPRSAKNEMLIFGLCSTSDDQLSNLRNESHPKCKKIATKLSKNEMLNFGLHSTFDGQPSNLRDKSHPKCEKNGCQIIKNCNTHFWNTFNF